MARSVHASLLWLRWLIAIELAWVPSHGRQARGWQPPSGLSFVRVMVVWMLQPTGAWPDGGEARIELPADVCSAAAEESEKDRIKSAGVAIADRFAAHVAP